MTLSFDSNDLISDLTYSSTKRVRGRFTAEPYENVSAQDQNLINNNAFLEGTFEYAWGTDNNNGLYCQIQLTWLPRYFKNDGSTIDLTYKDAEGNIRIDPNNPEIILPSSYVEYFSTNGGFYCKVDGVWQPLLPESSTINYNLLSFAEESGNSTTTKDDPIIFILKDLPSSNNNLIFKFDYEYVLDETTYSIHIPEFIISRPSKYDDNLIFNKAGLNDFVNQIHEYPKTVFGITALNSTETNPANIGFGKVPVQIHGKWYGVPVQGLTGSGSGSGGNISSVDMIASYATYDASEVNNDPKIAISDKYVEKAGDTMTGLLRMGQPDDHGYSIIVQDQRENPTRSFSLGFSIDAPTRYGLYDDTNGRWILYSDSIQQNGQPVNPPIFNGKANELTTARQLAVDLSNTSANTTFNGSANVTNIKVSGTLPIANGGTGFNGSTINSVDDIPGATPAYMNLQQYLTHIHGYSPSDQDCLIGLRGKARNTVSYTDTNETTHTVAAKNDNLIFDLGAYGMQLYDTTKETALWAIDFKDNIGNNTSHTYVKRSGDTMTGNLHIKTSVGGSVSVYRPFTINDTNKDLRMNLDAQSNSYYIGLYSYNYAEKNNNSTIKDIKTSEGWMIYRQPDTGYAASEFNFTAPKVYNAVFNDYAEYRTTIDLTPGHVVIDQDDGSLVCSSTRLQPGAQVISDTYGHCMGETDTAKTPLAVAGRVLVYTYQPRENYHAGMAVCSAPDGTVDIMTREEIRDYPDCIIGIVSEIPQYETWGTDNVEVNGRIWIKVK